MKNSMALGLHSHHRSNMLLKGWHSNAATRSRLVVSAGSNGEDRARSKHGKQFEQKNRRRGRPAWMRSPYDSPLRDGNRDRLIGLLTERAAKTLMIYLMETNANVYSWLVNFYKENPIPRNGNWDEVSGEAFLRKLLSMPIEEAKYNSGRESLFDNVRSCGVDPRSIAQRVMEIRTQLSEEFIQELQAIAEENSLLLRETLATSLLTSSVDDTEQQTGSSPARNSSSSSTNSNIAANRVSFRPRPVSSWKKPPPSTAAPAAPTSSSSSKTPDAQQQPKDETASIPSAQQQDSSSGPPAAPAGSGAGSEKAAAVAALNAALNASLPADVASSHPELQDGQAGAAAAGAGSGDGTVNMQDVIAQLKRSLDADVAMLTGWEADGEPDSRAVPAGDADASSSATAAAELVLPADEPVAPTAAAPEGPGDALASSDMPATADGGSSSSVSPVVEAVVSEEAESPAGVADADAFAATPPAAGAELPKGWGPRLGVGFSQVPARNNIVSVRQLTSKASAVSSTVEGTAQQQGSTA